MRLVDTPVSDPDAHLLLEHYFTSRELDFPPHLGRYRVTFPDPGDFVPPQGVFVVIRDGDDEPVGCGGIRRVPAGRPAREHPGAFEVKHVWLEPAARGRGWAGILMQHLEHRARAFGATAIVLDTNASLTGAAKLYARLCYADIPAYNDNPNATNWYRKALS